MAVSEIPSTSNVTGTTPTTPATTAVDNGLGKDTFMKLLVAQLKYQDPMKPTDSTQFLSQMAQFSTVEKLTDLQTTQTQLATWQKTVAGQGMIGKSVTATTTTGATSSTVTGVVTGLRLTDAGPRLVLDNGTTVGVDDVTDVVMPTLPTAPSPAPAPAAPATGTATTTTGTSAGG
jgi:flagellar basal-body rod modification protein FlgD